jgi:hypothetical protein
MESKSGPPFPSEVNNRPQPSAQGKSARLRVFFILLAAFLTLIAATAISVGYTLDRYWESALRVEIERSLTQKAELFASRINTDHTTKIEDIA